MQLRHLQSITQPSEGIQKVTTLCWAPNGKRLAVCTIDRVVLMFDEEGARKDKFSTKPADKGPKNYVVRQMTFSPQSDKLAIAQTDNIVFIYKLGSDWGEKKSICNKFPSTSPPTCLAWPLKRPNDIIYGLAEGAVKLGQLKTHKPTTLYQTDSYVTAMACNPRGNAVVSAHLDGSIYTYWFESSERGAHVIARHPTVPFSLAWGGSIVVAGNDRQITFYDEDGGEEGTFDHSNDPNCREFTAAASNPTGDAVVLGNYDSFYVYARNKDTMGWEEKSITKVENMYSVTALGWKSDGGKLAVGTLCGIVDLYDVCLKRTMYKGGFELTYVSHSQVIVRHIETNIRVVVRSQYGLEITKTNIYHSRYVIANTSKTLLLADLETLKVSEVEWHGDGTEKYIFDNTSACIIYYAGEVSIVEYGVNEFLGTIRTSHISSHVLSLRINERPMKHSNSNSGNINLSDENKKVAFLLDALTICIKDLVSQGTTVFSHDIKIDWLELNGRANLLLFRDKRRLLHLYNLHTQVKTQLLNFCTYVQWVPNSDVVVAQNRNNLCVWYNINAPEQITMHAIKGDIEEIERLDGRTEVIVDEGMEQAVYPLDSALIEFGTAIDDHDFLHAMEVLESLELSSESEAMWLQLSSLALNENEFRIAQRCQAAVGNVAQGKYLGKIVKIKESAEEELGLHNGSDHYQVRSYKNLLQKNLKEAEDDYLLQGKVDECIEMYQKLFKYEEAIRVAEQTKHPDTQDMRMAFFQYLLDSNQEEKAAVLKEQEYDFQQAVNLYLKAGLPARAAQVILNNNILQPTHLLESVVNALIRGNMHDIAGDFYELLNDLQRALDSYIRGHAYRKAVDLARRSFPGRVVELQEHWGDYLVSQKQIDMAINHYIEAKVFHKAIEAAMNARQFSRALQLVDAIDSESSRPYYKQLARHYEEIGSYDLAERCYVSADQPQYAVEMHTRLGNWELAHKIATNYMNEGEVGLLYINQAQKLEAEGRFKEAEKMYLTVKERDLAINMYKKNRRFDDMIRLVQEQRPDLLKETHQFLAQTLEVEGSLREAEHHYVEAQEWHSAVNMYRSNELWDDAIRVAKFYGGINACKRVTIALLMAIGVQEGIKYLLKHGLVEAAIEHATENGAFDMAFELATTSAPKKLPEIHLKHALFLEDDEQFQQAEEEFIKAGKPKEAIDMHVHQLDWASALRVAEEYEPSAVSEVYVAHARSLCENGDMKGAEDLFIAALHPELALNMYQEAESWQDALRIAQLHLPHRVAEINIAHQSAQARTGKGGSKKDFIATAKGWEQSKHWIQAIEAYLAAKKDVIDSIEDLEDLWDRAIEIARNHVPNKFVEVAVEVSRRLIALGREETAADILFEIGRQDEAVTVCLTVKKFEKAKALAQGNAALKRRVDEAYQGHLVLQEDGTGELVELGRTDVALDVLAKRGDWDRVWDVATKEKLPQATLAKYVVMRCEQLLKGNAVQVNEAVNLLNTRPGPATDAAIPFYHQLVSSILSRSYKAEQMVDQADIVSSLRELLFKLAKQYRGHAVDKQLPVDIEELLMATHYQSMYYSCLEHGLIDTAAKCSITLLKYPEIISPDKAFYQAGVTVRDQGNTNLAFLLLNRYVDLTEAIDTGDTTFLDSGDFNDADAIPLNGPLPEAHYLEDEDMREDVRTWVLSVVTDSKIEQKLPSRERSRNTLYDGLFSSDRPTCIVSGYPVYPSDLLEINNSTANRKEWNALVSKTRMCPWTRQPQNPIY